MTNLSKLNLNLLWHFQTAARLESLSRAAKELNLSAPTITHSINRLEEQLGFKLCIRARNQFQLTDRGRKLFEKASVAFSELQSFTTADQDPKTFSGILSLGVIDHFESARFQNSLASMLRRFPELKLSIQVYDSETIQSLVKKGELDFGFGVFPTKLSGLQYVTVNEEPLRYFISNKHPLWTKKTISKEDLTGQRVVWVDTLQRSRANLEAEIFSDHRNYKMTVAGYSNNLDAASKILLSGWAVVPLPPSFAKRLDPTLVKALEIKTKAPLIREECVFTSRSERSLAAAEFLRTELFRPGTKN